jgi:hypothetical protein
LLLLARRNSREQDREREEAALRRKRNLNRGKKNRERVG